VKFWPLLLLPLILGCTDVDFTQPGEVTVRWDAEQRFSVATPTPVPTATVLYREDFDNADQPWGAGRWRTWKRPSGDVEGGVVVVDGVARSESTPAEYWTADGNHVPPGGTVGWLRMPAYVYPGASMADRDLTGATWRFRVRASAEVAPLLGLWFQSGPHPWSNLGVSTPVTPDVWTTVEVTPSPGDWLCFGASNGEINPDTGIRTADRTPDYGCSPVADRLAAGLVDFGLLLWPLWTPERLYGSLEIDWFEIAR